MKMDDRKLKILQAVIADYITTAQPIGSRTIAKKYELGISSATIRNEMSDLEEMGFLEQPHTSAGRIPSERAYRLYVDRLMRIKKLTEDEQTIIMKELGSKADEIESIVRKTAKILSHLTRYTSLAMNSQLDDCRLRHIHFVPIDNNSLVAVIVTDSGIVKNTVIKTADTVTPDYLESLTKVVNEIFQSATVEELNRSVETDDFRRQAYRYRLLDNLISLIVDSLEEKKCDEVYADGMCNIFNFPEYSDVSRARSLLALIEDKEQLAGLINRIAGKGIKVSIGSELDNESVRDCSLVTATYSIGDKEIGKIGIIGPTRMEYARVVAIMGFMADQITCLIKKQLGE